MAADAYVQVALTQLQSAIGDMQQQIDGLRRQTGDTKQQLQREVQKLEQQRKLHEAELPNMPDDTSKHAVQEHVNHLHHDSEDKKTRIAQLDSEIAPIVQRKTTMYNNLQNLAQQLNVIIASPDLH